MSTEIQIPGVASEVAADLNAVLECVFAGIPIDPAVACRVQQRSELVQEEIRRKYGELNIAVKLIREIRDEE